MGNNSTSSANVLAPDLVDATASVPVAAGVNNRDLFKVDNINSHGRKHASAKIELSYDGLCIRQKHRQSLHIPLDTIKRYGLDGSIFILECGRRAPLGQARYAFRCKQARRLVDCLDQHIATMSKQLIEQQQQQHQRRSSPSPSPSTLTNVSSTPHHRRRRTQSDQAIAQRAPSSILVSSSSSSMSLSSSPSLFYRNSEPNLSENYMAFDSLPSPRETSDQDEEGQFHARLKQHIERHLVPHLNYVEVKAELPSSASQATSFLTTEEEVLQAIEACPNKAETEVEVAKQVVQQPRKRALLSLFNHHHKSSKLAQPNQIDDVATTAAATATSVLTLESSSTTPYAYIDHEKTTTLKQIAEERQQQHSRRVEN